MKLLSICLVSSDVLALAKLIKEQYTAAQAHHFSFKRKWSFRIHNPKQTL